MTTLTDAVTRLDQALDTALAKLEDVILELEHLAPVDNPEAHSLDRIADAGLWVASLLAARAGDEIEAAEKLRGYARDGLTPEVPDDLRQVLAELAAAQLSALVARYASYSPEHRREVAKVLASAVTGLASSGVLRSVAAAR